METEQGKAAEPNTSTPTERREDKRLDQQIDRLRRRLLPLTIKNNRRPVYQQITVPMETMTLRCIECNKRLVEFLVPVYGFGPGVSLNHPPVKCNGDGTHSFGSWEQSSQTVLHWGTGDDEEENRASQAA